MLLRETVQVAESETGSQMHTKTKGKNEANSNGASNN